MSTVFNFVSRGVKVHNLDIRWDLYWAAGAEDSDMQKELEFVNKHLTSAAIKAIENQEPTDWYKVSEYYAGFGAADTEPRWQFADLWKEAYGEDIS
jgi:hypothetical protein